MKLEKSCGAIVYFSEFNNVYYLLILHKNGGHWAFPKGHVEKNEIKVETALREVREETGLTVELNEEFEVSTKYSPKFNVIKEVVYFLGESKSQSVTPQDIEVDDFAWLTYEEALERLTYPNDKIILQQAHDFIYE